MGDITAAAWQAKIISYATTDTSKSAEQNLIDALNNQPNLSPGEKAAIAKFLTKLQEAKAETWYTSSGYGSLTTIQNHNTPEQAFNKAFQALSEDEQILFSNAVNSLNPTGGTSGGGGGGGGGGGISGSAEDIALLAGAGFTYSKFADTDISDKYTHLTGTMDMKSVAARLGITEKQLRDVLKLGKDGTAEQKTAVDNLVNAYNLKNDNLVADICKALLKQVEAQAAMARGLSV